MQEFVVLNNKIKRVEVIPYIVLANPPRLLSTSSKLNILPLNLTHILA